MSQAVIVATGRSAIAKAIKGSLARVHPVDFGAEVLNGVLARLPQLDPARIDDVLVGCALPETTMGLNPARNIVLRAGLPDVVAAATVNRYCSSGLQAIALASASIEAGFADIMVTGGVEHMSSPVVSDTAEYRNPWLEHHTDAYLPMGETAERVAEKWGIGRPEMEQMAVDSHTRASAARDAGKFVDQIIPVRGISADDKPITFDIDECVRPGTNLGTLAKLRPVFREDGLVTAATSSQMSDGAGFAVLMSNARAEELGIAPLARIVGFAVGGVDPQYMGIGPIVAVPKVLVRTGLSLAQMDVIELNEAFASQSLAVMRELGMDWRQVNPNGGALAMGHPLGATGAILVTKVLSELTRTGGRYGLVTMCIGGGMGAAGIIERL